MHRAAGAVTARLREVEHLLVDALAGNGRVTVDQDRDDLGLAVGAATGLAQPAEDIMVGDLIRAIDGPLAPVRCASMTAYAPCTDCADPDTCAIRALMWETRQALCSVLDRRSLTVLSRRAGNEAWMRQLGGSP